MNREEARQYILARATDLFERDKSGKGWLCPTCPSGSGDKGTGITTKDGRHFTCWAGCFSNSDIFDIIALKYHIPKDDYNAKLQKACELFHITIENEYSRSSAKEDFAPEYQNQPKIEQNTQHSTHNNTHTTTQAEEPDYTTFFLKANEDLGQTDYHRGLSLETLNRFKVGFVAEWRHPKIPKMKLSPRLIIPTSKHSYTARHASKSDFINYRGQVENKSKVGRVRVFNSRALWEAQKPVFVVEGEIDAMSIIDVGGEAIALGGVGKNALKLLLEKKKPAQPLILALDNDAVGDSNNNKLAEMLDELGITYYRLDVFQPYKDANEALNADREAFTEVIAQAENVEEEMIEAEKEELQRESVLYSLQDFLREIEESKSAPYFPTGFGSLDNILDGGLYAGLYIVGAISSLGKTTFCLQIADQVAKQGHDVLIFSLEMAKKELIAKSISRLTLIKDLEKHQSTAHAKTTRGILTGSKYKYYSQTERELIEEATVAYGQNGAGNIYITEGVGNVGTAQIREKVERRIKRTNRIPLILIDYLQILAPTDIRATDKQNTDKAVLELKRLSRDYSIPILAISSFNRDNYTAPVNLASFKESGAIEYSSDVLIGLQHEGMDYMDGGETDGARQKRIRHLLREAEKRGRAGKPQSIQVKILKNRNGGKGETLLDFFPMFNYFQEKEESEGDNDSGKWNKAKSKFN